MTYIQLLWCLATVAKGLRKSAFYSSSTAREQTFLSFHLLDHKIIETLPIRSSFWLKAELRALELNKKVKFLVSVSSQGRGSKQFLSQLWSSSKSASTHLYVRLIDKINNIARYNLIDTKYRQMAFQLARWCCSRALFGNLWSNKSEWWLPEGDNNPWNLLFSSQMSKLYGVLVTKAE